ncbi:class I SAM-dependent methyltransferase [Aestuariivirga litoralis]|uniref:class I SAM-dependent methyltransferase n=1 Tax=Aestuariivirga litoralis TaxID=2650924 RepID=UPI0018C4DC6D|nr:methyltransferase domain-containing protein [Aestuariivirga litoralis]MBG1233234.1 class I SAM-dependent methyltransferase [Aestuariivirga litoralis]
MAITDKNKVLKDLKQRAEVKIELGCGPTKQDKDALGIDILDYPGVDLIGDVYEVLKAFPASSVDSVYARHFIEHVPDVIMLLDELERIVKPGGTLHFIAPHFSNPYFYSDPTHKTYFGLYTFCYLAECKLFKRTVPNYKRELRFTVTDVKLGFKSSSAFPVRYALKRMWHYIFNATNYLREFHEENLCYLIPCYEVEYFLTRRPSSAPAV